MKKRHYTLTELWIGIVCWMIVIAISVGCWRIARWWNYKYSYKSFVSQQIEARVAPLEKKIAELQEALIEEGELRHAQTEVLDKVIGCMEKLEMNVH